MELRHNAWVLLFIFIVYTVIVLAEMVHTVIALVESVCKTLADSMYIVA